MQYDIPLLPVHVILLLCNENIITISNETVHMYKMIKVVKRLQNEEIDREEHTHSQMKHKTTIDNHTHSQMKHKTTTENIDEM